MRLARMSTVLLSLVVLVGCDCFSPTAPVNPNNPEGPGGPGQTGPTVVSLVVTGQNQLKVNATTQLTATANYSDGTAANVTTQSTWASNAQGVCGVNPAGVANGAGAGTCVVSATFTSVSGHLDIQVTVDPDNPGPPAPPPPPEVTLTQLIVSGPGSITVGQTVPWKARAFYSDGTENDVTAVAAWSSEAPGIAAVVGEGMVTGVAVGNTTIQAVFQGRSGSGSIVVGAGGGGPPTLMQLAVSGAGSVNVGQTIPWQARAFYSDGTETNVTGSATWSSAAPGIAAVAGGMVTGVAAGNTTIQAVFQGRSASGPIVVVAVNGPPTVTGLSVTGNTSIQVGQTSQLQAVASMSDGSSQNVTTTATWTSGAGGIATVSSTGLVTGQSAGSAPISAAFQGVSAGVTMQVSAPPPTTPVVTGLTIQGPPCGVVGTSSQLQAIAQMSDGTTQNRTATATWTSSQGNVASVSAGLVQCQAVGSTTITATVPGPHSANVPVTVVAAPVIRQLIGIRADIEGHVLTGNGVVGLDLHNLLQDPLLTVNVFALYSDGSEENVTAAAVLSTSNPLLVVNGPGVVNAAGVLVQALVNPSHYINVTYQGFTVIANVVIDVPVLGELPITGLLLNGPLTSLSVGTRLPDLTAILSGPGVSGTVNLLVPVGTAGVNWNIRPKLLSNCGLLTVLCNTANAALQGLGNLADGVVTIVDGTVQSLSLGPLNAILAPVASLLGGVLQVDINPVINGIAGPVTTIALPL